MLWQVRIGRDGAITARPIPARATAAPGPEFHPLIVNDGDFAANQAIKERRLPDIRTSDDCDARQFCLSIHRHG